MKIYDIAIKLNPYYYQAYVNKGYLKQYRIGKLLNNLKKYEEAHQMFDKALELYTQYYKSYLNRGNSYFSIGDYERAIQLYDHAIKLNPQDPEIYLKKGDSFIVWEKWILHSNFLIMRFSLNQINRNTFLKVQNLLKILQEDNIMNRKNIGKLFYDLLIKIYPVEGQLKKGNSLQYFTGQSLIAFGNKLAEEIKYEDAITIFDQLIQINQIEGYLKKGDILVILKRNEEPFQLFDKVIQYKPNKMEFIVREDKYLKQNNVQVALKYYDLLIRLNPLVGYFKKGDLIIIFLEEVLIDLGNNEEAFQMFDETIKYNKDQEQYISRGLNFILQQKYREALQIYDVLIKLNPKTGYLKKGDTLITLGRIEEAFEMFQLSIYYKAEKYDFIQRGQYYFSIQQKYDNAFKLNHLALSLVEQFLLSHKFEDQGQNFLNILIEINFQEQDYEDAVIFYDVMINLNPKEGYFKKGDRLMQLGRVKEAFEVYTEASRYNKDFDQYIKRGDKLLQEQKYGEALQFYDLLIELSQKTGYVEKGFKNKQIKGDMLISLGRLDEGFQVIELAIKHYPVYSQYLNRGDKYFKVQKFEEALGFYDLLIKLKPLEGCFKKGFYYNISQALLSLGKIEEAFEAFNKALKYDATQNELKRKVISVLGKNNMNQAIKFYDILVILNPSKGYFKRGDTLVAQEKIEEAFQSYSEAVQFNPNKQEYINRGDKCIKEKKLEEAFKFYNLLFKLDQKIGYLKKGFTQQLSLGEILIAFGLIEEAIQVFNQVIQYEYDEYEYEYPIRESIADKLYASEKIDDAINQFMGESLRFLLALIQFKQGIYNNFYSKIHVGQQLIKDK
ncbi:Transmembrane and TPR repeat-containing protein 1 [Paramecium bursaria]